MMTDLGKWPIVTLALLAAGGVLALGLAGWIRHAGELLLALGAAGLSWCL